MPNCMPSTFLLYSKTCCWQGVALAASTDISLEPSVLGDASLGHDDKNPTLWCIFVTAQCRMPSACTEMCPTLGHVTRTFESHLMGSPYTHRHPHRAPPPATGLSVSHRSDPCRHTSSRRRSACPSHLRRQRMPSGVRSTKILIELVVQSSKTYFS